MLAELTTWLHGIFGQDIDWKQVLLIGMTPVFIFSFLVEWVYQTRVRTKSEDFDIRDTFTNLSLGASYQVMEVIMWAVMTSAVFTLVYDYRVMDVSVTAWNAIPIFIGVEFCYYWFHRASHRVRWFWTAHVTHHSGEHMNFTMAMRQSMLNAFLGNFVFYLPMVILGVHPGVVMFMLAINLSYQYFVHTNMIGKLPAWFEFVFNTPSHHRVHHGKNAHYIDRNYGGVLIIFDRLFGTFEPEIETPVYGIVRQVHSNNFIVLNLHEMIDMWRDVMRPGPLAQRLKHIWGPPEWERPDGVRAGPGFIPIEAASTPPVSSVESGRSKGNTR